MEASERSCDVSPEFIALTEIASVAPAALPETSDATHWTARLLGGSLDDTDADATNPPSRSVDRASDDARRFAIGLGLASVYGLAAGARQGGVAFAKSAALVPAAIFGACALGLPALYIALGMVDAPLAPKKLFAAASRATASAGLVLAGLAPAAALYVVSSGDRSGAAVATALGLAAGSLAGLRSLWRDLAAEMRAAREAVKLVTVAAVFGFAVFAAAVGCRVWLHLPLFAAGVR
jgi:hypothetical protein